MVDEVRALALLHEANPVPDLETYEVVEADVTAYLGTLEKRSSAMTQLNAKPPSDEEKRMPAVAWLVAAVALVILGVAMGLMTQGSGGAPVATTPTATTLNDAAPTTVDATPTTVPAPALDGIALATAAIDVWNSGDFDAWLELHEQPVQESDVLFARSVMNSNEHMEITAACAITTEPGGPLAVICPIHVEDDFHGAGGVNSDGTIEFVFDEAGLIAEMTSTTYEEFGNCCPAWQDYHRNFFNWLEQTHPDVHDEIGPADGSPVWYLPGYASGNADHMLVALEYVDEFVADSDSYPLEPTDP